MSSRISRRSLVSRASALGAGAALSGPLAASAQSTPVAPAGATPASTNLLPEAEAVIQNINEMGGTIRMLSAVTGGKTPEEDELFAREITRLTGVTVELVHPTAEYDEKLLADLAAGVEYDLIYLGQDTMFSLAEQGVLTPLTDQIESSELLSNPNVIPSDEWEQVRFEDDLWGVFNKREGARMPIVRQDWMDALGLEQPQTLDDFYNVMVAFRDEDPAGNGPGNTVGLSTAGTYDIQPFLSAQGIRPGYVEVDGNRVIPWATEEAAPVYEWLAMLYAEGLYDQNFATNETSDMRALFLSNQCGFVTYWDTWVGLFNNIRLAEDPNTEFRAKGIPGAEGPDGNVIISRGAPGLWSVPVNAQNPETAFAFLEWWNTIPGIRLGTLGIEGHDYTVTNGEYALTAVGEEHGMDHGQPTPYNSNWENPIGTLPGLEEAQEVSAQHAYLAQTGLEWPTEIEPLLSEFIIQIILGDLSATEGIAALQDQLRSGGYID